MAAVILTFDRRARTDAELTRDQTLSRVRTMAICNGCTGHKRGAVETAAKKMIDAGIRPHEVIRQAKGIAIQLAKPSDQVPA